MTKWLIIDGYNLIGRAGNTLFDGQYSGGRHGVIPSDMAGKRRGLVSLLEKMVGILAERITVVFDGCADHCADEQEDSAVEVLYSPRNKTADTVVEQMVFQAGRGGQAVVVTSDRPERETAEASGAETMACSVFLDQLHAALGSIEQDLRARAAAKNPAAPISNPFSGLQINPRESL